MNLEYNSNHKFLPVVISIVIIFALLAVVSLFSHEAAGKLTVIPQSSSPYGKPYSNWTADWWRWYIQTPFDQNHQSVDPTGAQCARAQSGPVWFISGSEKVGIEKTCVVPKGKAILVPILIVECSYVEDKKITNVDGLRNCAAQMADNYQGLKIVYDGNSVTDKEIHQKYRVVSSPFTVNFPAKNVFTATPPGPTTSVSDGYWIMFQPPSPGNHQIKFGGCYQSPAVSAPTEQPTGNFCQDVTYNLKVLNK